MCMYISAEDTFTFHRTYDHAKEDLIAYNAIINHHGQRIVQKIFVMAK